MSPPQRALVLAVAGGTKQVATTDRAITIRPYAGWELLPKQARVRALVISVLFVLIVGRYATSHRATTAQNPPVLMTAATLQNAPASSTPAPSPQNAAVTGDSGHSPRAVAAKVTASTTAKQAPASLRINVEHHFTSANLRIVIDRRLAYTHELRGNVQRRLFLLRKVEGSESDALKLSPGKHAIQVSVESSVDAPTQSRTVVGRFVSGRQTILQINFTKNGDMNVALL